ncbi:MAG: metal ABC transporter ATP-binding protein [Christensenellales bacterium]
MKIFECKKLNIGYGEKCVCKDISFSIEKGQYVVLVGENGSGKSTLLKTILGLIKPISGKVIFDKDFNKSCIGYLPQQTDAQKDFPAIVSEVVFSGLLSRKKWWRPFYTKADKTKALDIMKYLGIQDLSNKSYKDLSGGQQQKVLLARSLCATDELLFLDEPTNALDIRSRKKLYELLTSLNEKGITIIMVSHNIKEVIDDVTHIVYLRETQKFAGSKEDFLKTEYAKLNNLKGEED